MRINISIKQGVDFLSNKCLLQGTSFLSGILGALMVFIIMNVFTAPKISIGTINITGLIDQFIKQEGQKNVSPEVLQQEVKTFGMKLEKELKAFSKQNHLILLPSEAVVSGSEDYTMIIKHKMNDIT